MTVRLSIAASAILGLSASTAACPGDFTNDQQVNIDDLLWVINNWGQHSGIDQLLLVINHWAVCEEDLLTYDNCPLFYVETDDREQLRALLLGTVAERIGLQLPEEAEVAWFGDSITGLRTRYCQELELRFFQHHANLPATTWIPPATWGAHPWNPPPFGTLVAHVGGHPSAYNNAKLLPGFDRDNYGMSRFSNADDSSFLVVESNFSNMNANVEGTGVDNGFYYPESAVGLPVIDQTAGITLRVLALSHPESSDAIMYRVFAKPNIFSLAGVVQIASGTMFGGPETLTAELGIAHTASIPLPNINKLHYRVQVSGTTPTSEAAAQIIGAQFVSGNKEGVSITFCSRGGSHSRSLWDATLPDYEGMPMHFAEGFYILAAMNPSVVVYDLNRNDVDDDQYHTMPDAETYEQSVRNGLALIRVAVPDSFIILLSATPKWAETIEEKKYAGAMLRIG